MICGAGSTIRSKNRGNHWHDQLSNWRLPGNSVWDSSGRRRGNLELQETEELNRNGLLELKRLQSTRVFRLDVEDEPGFDDEHQNIPLAHNREAHRINRFAAAG